MIVPDANLLLYTYDSASPFHRPAAKWWVGLLSGTEPVGLCPVVVFAFLRLATHAKVFDFPLTVAEASERVESWLARPNVRLLVGPKGMTPPQVAFWDAAMSKVAATEDWKKEVERNEATPDYTGSRESAQRMAQLYGQLKSALVDAGLAKE